MENLVYANQETPCTLPSPTLMTHTMPVVPQLSGIRGPEDRQL